MAAALGIISSIKRGGNISAYRVFINANKHDAAKNA